MKVIQKYKRPLLMIIGMLLLVLVLWLLFGGLLSKPRIPHSGTKVKDLKKEIKHLERDIDKKRDSVTLYQGLADKQAKEANEIKRKRKEIIDETSKKVNGINNADIDSNLRLFSKTADIYSSRESRH